LIRTALEDLLLSARKAYVVWFGRGLTKVTVLSLWSVKPLT